MSNISLTATTWQDIAAWRLESADLRLVVVPRAGARIVSLFDKAAEYEWLVSSGPSYLFRDVPYGAPYNANNTGGWDEMLPTIIACSYPGPGDLHGIALPDHGEAWILPWDDAGTAEDRIRLSLTGRALPYRLTRTISFTGARDILLDYRIENLSAQPVAYLWAAHPQFACESGAKILLPPDVREVVNVLPVEWGEEWGPVGTHNAWPALRAADGTFHAQDTIGPADLHRGRKFYALPNRPISWAGLAQPDAGCRLILEWDQTALPYCGVWVDEGYLSQVPVVAIEPATGYYDDLTVAWQNGRIGQVEPGSCVSWQLTVHILNATPEG
jgi:galactose mutarotase-like enzyme